MHVCIVSSRFPPADLMVCVCVCVCVCMPRRSAGAQTLDKTWEKTRTILLIHTSRSLARSHTSHTQVSLFLAFIYIAPLAFAIGGGIFAVLGVLAFVLFFGVVLRFTGMAKRTVEPGVSELKLFYPNPGGENVNPNPAVPGGANVDP